MHRPPVLLRAAYLKNLDLSGGGGCSLLPVKPVIPPASSPNGAVSEGYAQRWAWRQPLLDLGELPRLPEPCSQELAIIGALLAVLLVPLNPLTVP